MTDPLSLTVACDYCGAWVGEGCVTAAGNKAQEAHQARREDARDSVPLAALKAADHLQVPTFKPPKFISKQGLFSGNADAPLFATITNKGPKPAEPEHRHYKASVAQDKQGNRTHVYTPYDAHEAPDVFAYGVCPRSPPNSNPELPHHWVTPKGQELTICEWCHLARRMVAVTVLRTMTVLHDRHDSDDDDCCCADDGPNCFGPVYWRDDAEVAWCDECYARYRIQEYLDARAEENAARDPRDDGDVDYVVGPNGEAGL
jgi:hypothetical protein